MLYDPIIGLLATTVVVLLLATAGGNSPMAARARALDRCRAAQAARRAKPTHHAVWPRGER
jgi:hypothetical protein